MRQWGNQMPPKILVVEDDVNLNRLYTRKLAQIKFHVDSVFSIAEAMNYLDHGNVPILVILDMNLPDGSGASVMERLSQAAYRKTRVIVVSGEAYSRHHTIGQRKPDYELMKPVSPRMLTVLANQVINEATLSQRGISRRL
jgi:DNA-binding response OmpR family regulator